jgi:opacity protein-like surface antigen
MKSAILIALLALCATANAAPGSGEKGQAEFSFGLTYSFDASATTVNGSSIDFDGQTGFMFGGDYFIADRLSIGFDFGWARPDYNAILVPEDGSPDVSIRHEAYIWTGQFNGAYYFTDKPVTPFVEAGLGWTNFDSNVADEPPITGCWWGPFGYMCSTYYSTYDNTSFSYGAGLGLRWNLNYDMSVKATYRWLEVDSGNLSQNASQETAMLELAYHF